MTDSRSLVRYHSPFASTAWLPLWQARGYLERDDKRWSKLEELGMVRTTAARRPTEHRSGRLAGTSLLVVGEREHPPVLTLVPPARRPTIDDATISIIVRNEEQMSASVRYVELAIAEANQVYNDEVLPRRERHRQIRDAARSRDEVGLDAMARAANAL